MSRSILLATAGHVDHGKSSLIERITGTHPDRLPQEKARGMTLDLGFAHKDGFFFIDVPGHADYLRHAAGAFFDVDGILFVVAATEGLQAQSLEHLKVLSGLKVSQILFVLTKTDLASPEQTASVRTSLQPWLNCFPKCSIVESSEDIFDLIRAFFSPLERSLDRRFFPDRAFSKIGLGTLVTGSALHEYTVGQTLTLFNPHAHSSNNQEKETKIKSLQILGKSVPKCFEFSRVGMALYNLSPEEIPRGSILVPIGTPKFRKFLVKAPPNVKFGPCLVQFKTLQVSGLLIDGKSGPRLIFKKELPFQKGDLLLTRPQLQIVEIQEPYDKRLRAKIERPNRLVGSPKMNQPKSWYRVSEDLMIHQDRADEIIQWISQFKSAQKPITLSDARDFFGADEGRKKIIQLLEFCDRQYWTYRKGNERFPFRLPSSPHPSSSQPRDAHEGETPSDHPRN